MKRIRWIPLAALLAWLAPVARAEELSFPGTAAGRHASAYFKAYPAGEEAMREFYAAHVAAASLQQRPVEPRLEVWRQMTNEFGKLTPERIREAGEDFIDVECRTERSGTVRLRFQCEADEPHGLLSLRVEQGTGGDEESAPADAEPAPKSDAELVQRLSARLDALAKADAFSGAVLLDKGGQRLFAHAYGEASRAEHRANDLDTRFNLGSINKLFTAVAIQQLAAEGKLKLDDTIDRYLPEYPKEKGSKVTIQMLLQHRGGVPDFFNARYQVADHGKVRTLADWFQFVRDEPLGFEPGTRQAYSNGGYLLLGMIVQNVSGEDYFDYIRKHVYVPAGMTRSGHFARDAKVDDQAIGYSKRVEGGGKGWAPNTTNLPGFGSPAGGGYSTAGDLLAFANAMRAKKLPAPDGSSGPIGLMGAGGSPGVNGFLQIEGDYTLVVLANLDPPAAEGIGEKVGDWIIAMSGNAGRPRVRVRAGGGSGHGSR